ncbi:outer membrane protein [Dyella telluris]|uniref:Outer membrane beta-barrel protein n=1 Tax=Dyella telluris TaxID=2763498 RepID=A0A7G8Q8L7_9GAMM|nr:outer membrane beta-barrel protein [Dyella telluris]QNK03125.1 outer membrane beta-barrel protein [Dyella telluris]
MNKTLLAAALAVVAAAPFAAKADENNQLNNFFVAGNLGQSNYRIGGISDKSDAFYNLRFGWRWNGIVGAELGYADLGKAKNDYNFASTWAKPRVAQLGVTAKYNFYNNWYVTGHGGYLRSRTTAGVTVGNVSASEKSWNNGWYAGAGVGYDVTQNVSLALNYDNYHVKYGRAGASESQANTNIAAYSASVEYRF